MDANLTGLNDDKVETSGDSMTGNLSFGDNNKVILGTGNDLQLYHDGSASYIDDSGAGDLVILSSARVRFEGKSTGDTYMRLNENSSVQIYHDNTARLTTTSTGIDVTGVITTDGITTSADVNFGDDDKALFGAGNDLKIYHSANNQSYIHEAGSGDLNVLASNFKIQNGAGTENKIVANTDGAVSLYYDNTARLATSSSGIDVTGTATMDGLTVDAALATINAPSNNADLILTEGGSNTDARIRNSNGILLIDADLNSEFGNSSMIFAVDGTDRLKINNNGNIGFYEDTGSTEKLTWSAASESLTFGTNLAITTNEIDVASGDLTLDVAGDIILDADGADIIFADGGTQFGFIGNSSSDMVVKSQVQDKDLLFKGNDGGSTITALTLDMSNAGEATFNDDINLHDGKRLRMGAGGDFEIFHDGSNNIFKGATSDQDMRFNGVDGGSEITALLLDMSAAGAATFNSDVGIGATPNTYSGYTTLTLGSSSNGGLIDFERNGTIKGEIFTEAAIFGFQTIQADDDIVFRGNDGGSTITALTLDMSAAGIATFNSGINIGNRGSASDPTLQSAIDPDTGVFWGGGDLLGFSTGGSERFRIASDGSLSTPTAGTFNVRFGVNAGNSIASGGIYNVLVGDEAGTAITTGDNNVAIGYRALDAEDTGSSNIAIGSWALSALNNDAASYNVAVGYLAGESVTTGVQNTLIGGLAGDAITVGGANIAVGYAALSSDTQGSKSIAIGTGALYTQNFTSATNCYNTAVGDSAGNAVTTGIQNTLIGGLAGDVLTDADYNVAVGTIALSSDTLGSRSTAVGYASLLAQNFTSATDTYNTAVGFYAGTAVTTGQYNTLIGGLAGDALTDADRNVAIGYAALSEDTLGSRSVAIGNRALVAQNFTSATNTYNVAIGDNAGSAVTTGTNNTLIGGLAGDAITTGAVNVAVGTGALGALTTASYNTGIGYAALSTNITGAQNTAVGYSALTAATGADNTAVGSQALSSVADGTFNTAVGRSAGQAVTTGINNTLIGALAGDSTVTSGGGNIILGYGSELGGAGQENSIVIATNSAGKGSSTGYINANGGNVFQGNNSANWATVSDERLKKNITNNTDGLSIINSVVVRNFEYKTPDEVESAGELAKSNAVEVAGTQLGVIAQELAEVCADCVVEHDTGVKSVQSDKLNWHMINAIKELSAQVNALTARIETLEG
jgi:hypothetical protein